MKPQEESRANLLEKAKFFYQKKAEHIAANRQKITVLLNKVRVKLQQIGEIPSVKESKAHIEIIVRMVKAHVNKEYRGISNRTLGLLVLGLLYFVLPVDFVPDFIPLVGYVDDVTVVLAIFKSVGNDIEKFLEWERTKI